MDAEAVHGELVDVRAGGSEEARDRGGDDDAEHGRKKGECADERKAAAQNPMQGGGIAPPVVEARERGDALGVAHVNGGKQT